MRKKIVITIVLVVIVATLAIALTSCNEEMDYVERLYENLLYRSRFCRLFRL